MSTLEIDALSLIAPGGQPLIDGLSASIGPGEVLAVMGASGSGKSSLLGWLTATLPPGFIASGTARLNGRSLNGVPTERRRIGLVLQADYLFPHMSVGDNLLFGLRGGTREERYRRMRDSLADSGLDGMENRDPATLSGGQRARVSLLRTLLSDPAVLLLDEPFSRLDAARREQIRRFTWEHAGALPVLLVTHDLDDVPAGARIIELDHASQGRKTGQARATGRRV